MLELNMMKRHIILHWEIYMNDSYDYLIEHTNSLYSEYRDVISEWDDSPFLWVKQLSSRVKGSVGEKIVKNISLGLGLEIRKRSSSDCDLIIGNIPAEVKLSMLWETGEYCFQQIRNQKYSYGILLGLSPHNSHLWVVPKDILIHNSIPQHGGSESIETRWLKFNVNKIPKWMNNYGGYIDYGIDCLWNTFSL